MSASADEPVKDLYKNPQWLHDAHYEQNRTVREMASICDVTFPTIIRWMDEFDIGRRDRNWRRRSLNPPKLEVDDHGAEMFRSRCHGERDKVYHHQILAIAWGLAEPHELFGFEGKDVHHRNEIPWDNREENLEVLSRSEHMSHHTTLQHERGEL